MHYRLLLTLLVLLPLVLPALAASPAAEAEFEAGTHAFKAQEYRRALDHFERAEQAGMSEARLFYNLGAVHYRLENYERSRGYFERLLDHPRLGALGYYNLGLIAHQSGERAEAIAYFEKCAEISADQGLAALAEKQIATLGGRPPKPWFGYVSAVYGYDSNITLLTSSSAANQSGEFVQALALGELTLAGKPEDSYELTLLMLATDFLDGDEFDDDLLTVGVERRRRAGGWHINYGLEAGTSTFAGEDYTDTVALSAGGRTGFEPDRELRLRLTLEDITASSGEFDFVAGSRAEFNASYRIDNGSREYRFEYGLESNDRENTATESFSPTRHRLRLRYFQQLGARTEIGSSIEFRDSDYRGVPGDDRHDQRLRLRLEGKYRFDADWGAQSEITYTDNDSNQAGSSYHKYQALVSINALF
jgi:tetratricopeptide (TPR) repeat protein